MKKLHPQIKGSALITALFIMTLVAIAATAMGLRLRADIYQTAQTIEQDQLCLATEAVRFWAMQELSQPQNFFRKASRYNIVAQFPARFKLMYPNIQLSGDIIDQQSKFNLNNLTEKKYQPFFALLLTKTLKRTDAQSREFLLNRIKDWISNYQPGRGTDAELRFYLGQKPPYYPAYQLFKSISELALVHGVSLDLYKQLEPHISVLPEPTPININTASKLLLSTLGNGLNAEQIEELIRARKDKGIQRLQDINPILSKLQIRAENISIDSTYFLVMGKAISKDSYLIRYSLIKREKEKNGKISLSLISETFNTL